MIQILLDNWKSIAAIFGIISSICIGGWKVYKTAVKIIAPLRAWVKKHDDELEESIKYRAEARKALKELLPNHGESIKDEINTMYHDIKRIRIKQFAQIQLSDIALFESDKEGHCIIVNKAWSELTGLSQNEAEGWGWLTAIHKDDRDRVKRELISALDANVEFNSEYKLSVKGEKIITVESMSLISRDHKRNIISVIGSITAI